MGLGKHKSPKYHYRFFFIVLTTKDNSVSSGMKCFRMIIDVLNVIDVILSLILHIILYLFIYFVNLQLNM
jgi:hypothetical protein